MAPNPFISFHIWWTTSFVHLIVNDDCSYQLVWYDQIIICWVQRWQVLSNVFTPPDLWTFFILCHTKITNFHICYWHFIWQTNIECVKELKAYFVLQLHTFWVILVQALLILCCVFPELRKLWPQHVRSSSISSDLLFFQTFVYNVFGGGVAHLVN